ncbi:hypothetical protein [Rhizobium mayense]|uniref:hypothetical protein n=1 Tax=Rhizobium mayense TaxID=1312184 RepID=UPI00398C73B5
MSIFDRLDRLTSRQIDRTFSIRFEVQPSKRPPNGRPVPDPDRELWEGKGVLEEMPNFPPVEMGRRDRAGNDLQSVIASSAIELSVDRARYPLADKTKQGDRIKTDDLRRFEVVSIKRDGLSRVIFLLTLLGNQPTT